MPKKCVTFISGFLIPHLNNKSFGDHLKWLDQEKKVFQLQWCHKRGPNWTEHKAEVFIEWDKYKGHYQPDDKTYFTKSKQRFRALLYKLTSEGQIKELKSKDKYVKIFSIGQSKQRKKKSNLNDVNPKCVLDGDIMEEVYSTEVVKCRTLSNNKCMNILEDHTYCCTDQQQNFFSGIGLGVIDCNVHQPDFLSYEGNRELAGKTAYNEKINFLHTDDPNWLQFVELCETYLEGDEKENSAALSSFISDPVFENLLSYPAISSPIQHTDVLFSSCVLENVEKS